jgi:membrane protein YdbS with pleckstrin-like domain
MIPAMEIRPSLKTVYAAYAAILALAAGIAVYWAQAGITEVPVGVPLLVPAALLLWAAGKHLVRRTVVLKTEGERIRYEAGLLSRTSRVMEIAKVQDVRVDQSLGQRIIHVGDLSLETAGDTSRIVIRSIDAPRAAAEHILELARRGSRPAP